MKHRTDIETVPLGNGMWRLNEFDFVNCFLVVGEEKACLIDAGAGVADLMAVVRTLTDKPLIVLITHAHADHIGGAGWFPEVYIHPADKRSGRDCMRPHQRAYFLHSHEYKRKSHGVSYRSVFQKRYRTVLRTLNEGDVFDLGGRQIETFFTPGHTHGSVSFRDSLTGALFTGDNVNPMVTLHFPRAATLSVWLESARRTEALAGENEIYVGHGDRPLPKDVLRTVIEWGGELAAAGNKTPGRVCEKRGKNRLPCILYRSNRIR